MSSFLHAVDFSFSFPYLFLLAPPHYFTRALFKVLKL